MQSGMNNIKVHPLIVCAAMSCVFIMVSSQDGLWQSKYVYLLRMAHDSQNKQRTQMMIKPNHYLCYVLMVCFSVSEYVTTELYGNFIKLLINEFRTELFCMLRVISLASVCQRHNSLSYESWPAICDQWHWNYRHSNWSPWAVP